MDESTRHIPADEPPPLPHSGTNRLAVASLVLGILSFVGVGLFFSIPGIITGHRARSRIRKAPGSGDATMALAGLILSYLNIVFSIAVILVLYLFLAPLGLNAASARSSLQTISTAELDFRLEGVKPSPNGIGQYGTLKELGAGATPLIDTALASGRKEGYVFTVTPALVEGVPVYTATAVPEKMGFSGIETFFVDQTGVIRSESDGSVATSTSPPMN